MQGSAFLLLHLRRLPQGRPRALLRHQQHHADACSRQHSAGNHYLPHAVPGNHHHRRMCTAGINFLMNIANIAPGQALLPASRSRTSSSRASTTTSTPRTTPSPTSTSPTSTSTYGYSPAPTFTNSSPTHQRSHQLPRAFPGRRPDHAIVSSTAVNQVHFQWGRDLETAGANAAGPSVATGVVTFGMPNALPRVAEPDEHRIQFTDVFSKILRPPHASSLAAMPTSFTRS